MSFIYDINVWNYLLFLFFGLNTRAKKSVELKNFATQKVKQVFVQPADSLLSYFHFAGFLSKEIA